MNIPKNTTSIIVYLLDIKNRFVTMKFQWMTGLVLLVVIPLLILTYVTYNAIRSETAVTAFANIENCVVNTGNALDLLMTGVENKMLTLAQSASFKESLNKLAGLQEPGDDNRVLKQALTDWLAIRFQKDAVISRIMILGGEHTSVNCNFRPGHNYAHAVNSMWYQKALALNGKFLWIDSHPELEAADGAGASYSMSCVMALTEVGEGRANYILIMDLARSALSKLLSPKTIPGRGRICLIGPGRRIVAQTLVKDNRSSQAAVILRHLPAGAAFASNKRSLVKELPGPDFTKAVYYSLVRSGWILGCLIQAREYPTGTGGLFWILTLTGIILAAAVIGGGLFFTRRITGRLQRVITAFRKMESGYLDAPLPVRSRDEIDMAAAAYNAMLNYLTPFIAMIRNLTEKQNQTVATMTSALQDVAATISDVLVNVGEVTESAIRQSTETEDINSFINDLAQKVDLISSHIKSIQEIGTNTQNLTATGIQSIKKLNENVTKTNDITLSISEHLNILNEETSRITEMVSSINEIADRNNILALNSLINAAKAGESGKGFSVVANNVKKLAERSMIVTREISDFISNLQKRMAATAVAASGIGASVEAQNQAFNDSIRVFNRINTVTGNLTGRLTEIIKLAEDMDTNKQNTLNSTAVISFRTRQMAVMMNEIRAALELQLKTIENFISLAKDLKRISHNLQQAIKDFKIA